MKLEAQACASRAAIWRARSALLKRGSLSSWRWSEDLPATGLRFDAMSIISGEAFVGSEITKPSTVSVRLPGVTERAGGSMVAGHGRASSPLGMRNESVSWRPESSAAGFSSSAACVSPGALTRQRTTRSPNRVSTGSMSSTHVGSG